jgi:DNA-directed RNA polymerase specialized sigma24 family protein
MIPATASTNVLLWSFLGFSLLSALLTGAVITLAAKGSRRQKELLDLQKKLDAARQEILLFEKNKTEKKDFVESLSSAAITTKLQEPRLQLGEQDVPETPEKYRYLVTMARNGMSTKDISDILDISEAEAGQLVKLARIALYSS